MTEIGDRVVVDAGRWGGRSGVIVRYSFVVSGQTRVYPVVRLDDGREVRVASVSPEEAP